MMVRVIPAVTIAGTVLILGVVPGARPGASSGAHTCITLGIGIDNEQ